ncbi:MAG: OsmC/Ohr family protein [Nitrospirae bacterium]|jgi:putative redox protein|nr:OsmC/Ohr family protein [Nitrospirota bacterium]
MLHAQVTHVTDMQFVGEASSGHAIVMDGDPSVGGHNTGVRPAELLLLGIGGCSGMDVISILRKKRQDVSGLSIHVRGKKAEDYPRRFTEITLEFVVKGRNISEEAVKRAIDLSMNKYCSVKATLEGSAEITFSYRIIRED